jgi:hypothetical protein
MCAKFWLGSLKERDQLQDLGIDGTVILNCISGKYNLGVFLDSCCLGCGPVAGPCEHSNKPSGSTKGGKFLD